MTKAKAGKAVALLLYITVVLYVLCSMATTLIIATFDGTLLRGVATLVVFGLLVLLNRKFTNWLYDDV